MLCPNCQHPLIDNAKFCLECGKAVPAPEVKTPAVCSGCQNELLDNAKFCPHCGKAVDTPPAERGGEIVKLDIKTPLVLNGKQFRINRSNMGLVLGIASWACNLLVVVSAFLCFVPLVGLFLLPIPFLFVLAGIICGCVGVYFGYQHKKSGGSYLQMILSAGSALSGVAYIVTVIAIVVVGVLLGGFLLFILLIISLLGSLLGGL